MGADRWTRRASGLLVPRLGFANLNDQPYPCDECCETVIPGDCDCTCDLCSDTAPCCWTVVIADIVAASPEDCEDCGTLNRTYSLRQDPDNECIWKCVDVAGVDCGDSTDITLTLFLDGSDYKIKVELGDHTWIKNYGTSKPDCCAIVNDALTFSAGGSDCDSSSATCHITRRTGTTCPCVPECDKVISPAPPCFKIEWTGISPSSPLDCQFCECYNTIPQWIPWLEGSSCEWRRDLPGFGQLCSGRIRITITESGGTWSVKVYQLQRPGSPFPPVLLFQRDYGSAPDVSTWNQEEIPVVSPIPSLRFDCDFAVDAKALLTPDYTTSCSGRPWACNSCRCQLWDDGTAPDVQVVISGITGSDCCVNEFNGTFILAPDPTNPCHWEFFFDSDDCSGSPSIKLFFDAVDVQLALFTGIDNYNFFEQGVFQLADCNTFSFSFNAVSGSACGGGTTPFPTATAL